MTMQEPAAMPLKWEARERVANRWSMLALAFVVGWICSTATYQLPKLFGERDQLARVEAVQIPALKKQFIVEKKKAAQAEADKKAIVDAVTGGHP
jgi:hypothetical protein